MIASPSIRFSYSMFTVFVLLIVFQFSAMLFACNALDCFPYSLYVADNGFYVLLGSGYYSMST